MRATRIRGVLVIGADADLLIVNAGMHSPPGPDGVAPGELLDYLGSSRAVLGLHAYSNLELSRPAKVLLAHRLDGVEQPLVLAGEDGPQRTVYDALGHGTESYAAPSRQELLRREVRWLLGAGETGRAVR